MGSLNVELLAWLGQATAGSGGSDPRPPSLWTGCCALATTPAQAGLLILIRRPAALRPSLLLAAPPAHAGAPTPQPASAAGRARLLAPLCVLGSWKPAWA